MPSYIHQLMTVPVTQ